MLEAYQPVLVFLATFAVLALAARQIGHYLTRLRLPLISGFLFAGILVGPYGLDLISETALDRLDFINEISLAFIAFAAGAELRIDQLRGRMHSIGWIMGANAVIVPIIGSLAVFILTGSLPFLAELGIPGRIAASLLAGSILVARSPSSAIAIVNELRAKGRFTQTTLGVIMLADVVVIVLFAISAEVADALLEEVGFSLGFVGLLIGELLLSLLLGYITGRLLQWVLSTHLRHLAKTALILLLGYGVFVVSHTIRENSAQILSVELLLEPLLIAMIGGFYVINYTDFRSEFLSILEEVAPAVYVTFFTLTGASMDLGVLSDAWLIAVIIFAVRLAAFFISSFAGGLVAGDPMRHNTLSWMAYVTQAGVGLGLATEVAVEFPGWGEEFATIIISIIVLSQVVGPPLHKWVINYVGESHGRGEPGEFDGQRDAIIFGVDDQSLVLSRQLQSHGWQVKLGCLDPAFKDEIETTDVEVHLCQGLNLNTLQDLEAEHADAIVSMLSDEENYRICELAYEHYGTETLVVRLNDRTNLDRFHELDVQVVEPGTAIVSLLDHFVRSPATTSILLGMDHDQDVVEIEVRNPALHGMFLRDLRLPLDTLVLSVRRKDHTILSHGYTRLELGDHVTLVGSSESLEQVMLRFDERQRAV